MARWGNALLAVAALTFITAAAQASAAEYAPVDQPGPALTAPLDKLRASVRCGEDVNAATREPVLLTPATTVDSRENFGWNYEQLLRARGIPFCTSDQPGIDSKNMNDMQTRAEYVVYAIRRVHELAGRRIAVMGHSQGGMIMRWALRFWPDTRTMVDDVIGFAGTNHGSIVVPALCVTSCAPSLWQQIDTSQFMQALDSRAETFDGISYTEVYSHADEFVQPNQDDSGTSSVHGPGRIANVALQDICPADVMEHLFIGTIDPAASALAMDALDHDGPADPSRIDPSVCTELLMPGVDRTTAAGDIAGAVIQVEYQLSFAAKVSAEPPLRCYVTASCPAGAVATAKACAGAKRLIRLPRWRSLRATLAGRRLKVLGRGARRYVRVKVATKAQTVRITGRTRSGRRVASTVRLRGC